MLTPAKYEGLCIAKFAGKQGQFVEKPEVRNGGGEDDPVCTKHILPHSKIHVAQFSLAPDVFHLNTNDNDPSK